MEEKEEMRVKIKKLKYKIQKEEQVNLELKTELERIKEVSTHEMSVERIFLKVQMKLQQKGMTIQDWLHSYDYQHNFDMDCLCHGLDQMAISLERGEKDLLLNFVGSNCSEHVTINDMKNLCRKSGIQIQ